MMILSSKMSYLYARDDTSEFCRFFQCPSFWKPIEESSTICITASCSIYYVLDWDYWYEYLGHSIDNHWSFFSECYQCYLITLFASIDKILSRHHLKLCSFGFIHRRHMRLPHRVQEFILRKNSHRLPRIKNRKNPIFDTFIDSSEHSLFRIRGDDSMSKWFFFVSNISRIRHSSRIKGINLTIFSISEDKCLSWIESFSLLCEMCIYPDSREVWYILYPIITIGSDKAWWFSEKGKRIGNIRTGTSIFFLDTRRKKWEVHILFARIGVIFSECTDGMDDGIECNGSGNKKRHKKWIKNLMSCRPFSLKEESQFSEAITDS